MSADADENSPVGVFDPLLISFRMAKIRRIHSTHLLDLLLSSMMHKYRLASPLESLALKDT
jgi:hypothetical protein